MINILNRKELGITYSIEEQAKIRKVLSQNKIDYSVKVKNRKSPSLFATGTRARTGTFGEKLEFEYEYIIYVYKKDYEEACFLTGMGSNSIR